MAKANMLNVYDAKRMTEALEKYKRGRKDSYAVFDPTSLCILVYNEDRVQVYEIDLERCTTAGQALDWIYQLYHKTWVTPVILRDIIECMDIVFLKIFDRGIQGSLCPCGCARYKDGGKYVLSKTRALYKALKRTTRAGENA